MHISNLTEKKSSLKMQNLLSLLLCYYKEHSGNKMCIYKTEITHNSSSKDAYTCTAVFS